MDEKPYHIEKRGNAVVLRTTSFRAERRSVLHSGVFNRELASSLAAGAVITVLGFFFALYSGITAPALIIMAFLFAAFFVVFRMCVFREPVLETVFDRDKGSVTISVKGAFGSSVKSYPLKELNGIRLHHISMQPENIDAVQLVERVAVQHGTVIPGFGKVEDFYTVEMDFSQGTSVIFSSGETHSAETVLSELKGFIGDLLPDTGGTA